MTTDPFIVFVKHDLKGGLNYIAAEICIPLARTVRQRSITDDNRQSLEGQLSGVLLQSTTKETHIFMDDVESPRITLRSFFLRNHS